MTRMALDSILSRSAARVERPHPPTPKYQRRIPYRGDRGALYTYSWHPLEGEELTETYRMTSFIYFAGVEIQITVKILNEGQPMNFYNEGLGC